MTSANAAAERVIGILEDTAELLKKTQINLKKCPKQRLTKGYIQSRILCIEDYWKRFVGADQELGKITPREKRNLLPYYLNEEFYIYEDLYLCLMGELRDMLEGNPSPSSAVGGDVQPQVKLPRISLPTFSGIYEEFPGYKDLYISLIHENKSLSNVEKLHYLKTSLSGEAAALLKHIQVTETNYQQAWETLKNRYGNLRLIVNSLLKRLFTQKRSNIQSANQLKSILDTTTEVLNSLQNLKINTDSWDPIIIFLVVQKLDPESHKEWEEYAYKGKLEELPTWEDFKTFLETKFRTLELVTPFSTPNTRDRVIRERALHASLPEKACIMCKENHNLCHCKVFAKMKPTERNEHVKKHHLCFNCLASGHSVVKCRVPMSCRICNRRHHTLIHQTKKTEASELLETLQPVASNQADGLENVQVNTMIASYYNARQEVGLLATAMVTLQSEHGHTIVLKALIDPGSQACFISEKATQLLRLKRQSTHRIVTGMESMKVVVKQEVYVKVLSQCEPNFSLPIHAYVMTRHLTIQLPSGSATKGGWPHLSDLNLADPNYYVSGTIDLLLDVKGYAQILQQGLVKGPPGTPIAQKTNLGWIIFGEMKIKSLNKEEKCFVEVNQDVDFKEILRAMWEVDTETKKRYTKEEQLCEDFFTNTHKRNKDGRYIVKLPFNTDTPQAPNGHTREIALNRFAQLEKRFYKQPELKKEYIRVIEEYKSLKHAEEVPEIEKNNVQTVYLPHHPVINTEKETTKTRVVFNASSKGSNGVSLNDELLSGPILQDDLRSLIMRWRMHAVCFVSDIEKMYRMILVAKEDTDYQRILWRNNPSDPIQDLRLLTVTFGTASAPYLAVKTLMQLASDEGDKHPEAARVLREDMYIDDVMSGADSLEEAIRISKDLKDLLRRGGFTLKKWSSSNVDFLKSIDPSERSTKAHLDINIDGTVKALGVQWNLGKDQFEYNLNLPPCNEVTTKRNILSDLQKLYDPLGWISPSIVMAKIFIQKLWQIKVDWDENIDPSLKEEWKNLRDDFGNVNEIYVERWLGTHNSRRGNIQIHGFSDASIKAYSAVVYCRVQEDTGLIQTSIIAARTRVAPLKTVSLPRLELCGALLLSKLLKQVSTAMRIPSSQVFAWTDSSIVLAWIQGEPSRWKTFVANRTVEIMENVPREQWFHVQSHENPADIASRGMIVSELKVCTLWWEGPEWLSKRQIEYTKPIITPIDLEKKSSIQTLTVTEVEEDRSISNQFELFDSLSELVRSVSYCRRFLKRKTLKDDIYFTLTTQELEESLNICIRKVQGEEYREEIDALRKNKHIKRTSTLKTLDPYLDEKQILRVGGRLRHSDLPDQGKHPIIIGTKNNLTRLIIAEAHSKTLHGGMQLMLCYLRIKYWIHRVKSQVKQYVHRCLTCAKHNATTRTQVMGDIPKVRVTPARPFLNSGVDFAGPFLVLTNKGRGGKIYKAYVSIFVCMATKAIHLELVGDLTSEAFISAFKRFCARRGRCAHLWSDQGRNFVGANKELVALWKEARLEFSGDITEKLVSDGTQWHFIPAYSPHFGGLWEAGVKSIKYHMKRILTTNLTFEEMSTLLCEIEACLNSRPLCPRDDLDDEAVEALTPGHFLIGESPLTIPSPTFQHVKVHHLSRWQYTQKLLNDFWCRWQNEYLCRLQQRPKWLKRQKEFEIGNIVLVKQENLPPGKWLLGRIVDKHPGLDGCTRVYSVKSGKLIVKRTVTKLCSLPIEDKQE